MKVIYNNILPFKGFLAINLFGILFVRKEYADRLIAVDINHEAIHSAQMKELLYVGFYALYLVEWLVRLFVELRRDEARTLRELNKKAYRGIRFEQEAFMNETDLDYLTKRKHFNWILL